ncbi:hypothetical protein Tco_0689353 [Tanacetum coccineum]
MFIKSPECIGMMKLVVMTRNYLYYIIDTESLSYLRFSLGNNFRDTPDPTTIESFKTVRLDESENRIHESMHQLVNERHSDTGRSENDAHADDADIRPIYDEEPMAEVQTTAEINIFATGQQHTEQPEFNNKGKVDQNG